MKLRVFALTGGIGSGKSSVARHYRERGVPIIDADLLAREVVAPGSPGLAEVIAAFGAEIVTAEGELDRAALARRVFADPAERAALERITHPRVRALAQVRFAELDARGEPLAGYEVPLLFEAGLEHDYHPTVVVSCSPAQQMERAARRDHKPTAAIQARIAAQMPLAAKVSRADYVIDNGGDFEATRLDADRVLAAICAELGVDHARYFAPQA